MEGGVDAEAEGGETEISRASALLMGILLACCVPGAVLSISHVPAH